jgi:hypothetical protein
MLNSLQGPTILSNLVDGCTHDLSFNARRRKNRRVRNCSVSIKAQVKKKKQKSRKKHIALIAHGPLMQIL